LKDSLPLFIHLFNPLPHSSPKNHNNCTIDLGDPGKDNIYGWGKVNLPSIPVPIQLASSVANVIRGNDVEVAWKTISETNNYGYEIYRRRTNSGLIGSSDANPQSQIANPQWTKIGFVEGHATTLAPQSYSYVDKSVGFGKYLYQIKQIDLDGKSTTYPEMALTVGVEPKKLTLAQNYPNPFNPSTTIEFTVPQASFVTMKVYNVLGQEVLTLFKGDAEAGKINTARFDASNLPGGVYFYRLRAGQFVETKKLVVLK